MSSGQELATMCEAFLSVNSSTESIPELCDHGKTDVASGCDEFDIASDSDSACLSEFSVSKRQSYYLSDTEDEELVPSVKRRKRGKVLSYTF